MSDKLKIPSSARKDSPVPMVTPATKQSSNIASQTSSDDSAKEPGSLVDSVKKIAKQVVEAFAGNSKMDDLAPFRRNPTEKVMTSDQGILISHTDDSLKAGVRGPSLLEDFHLREKMTRFDHERIPERVVHARGSAAHGVFEAYESMAEFTKAGFLSKAGTKTPVFVRFSTVLGSRGSADTVRDVRGFAVKFYTEEGNFDLVGNNIPVFFIQDGIKFPDVVHAAKPEAHHEIPGASTAHDTFWDFVSLVPESTHMLMWILSDRAIPRSFANMEGFGVHTFRLVNDAGKSRFVKFHWKPVAGLDSLVWDEAQKLAGKDPDFHRRALWQSIELGQGPEYELGVQIIEESDVAKFDFDLLDATKLVPEELVPVKIIGKLKLKRNPDNFFAETEQVAFHVGNLVPGIDVTNDPLLQARLFSYLDTQLTRLGGPNFAEIPINRPINKVHNTQQDGFSSQTIPQGRANYFPNSIGGGCPFMANAKEGGFVHHPEPTEGQKTRQRSPSFSDHFSQAAMFFNSLSAVEKEHLKEAACFELGKVEIDEIRNRALGNFARVNFEFAKEVALKVGSNPPLEPTISNKEKKVHTSPALSQMSHVKNSVKNRLVAVVVAEGFSAKDVNTIREALEGKGARIEIVSSRLGAIRAADGSAIKADKSFLTGASVFYDGVFIPSGQQSTSFLKISRDALSFVQEAYQHFKTIGAQGDAIDILVTAKLIAEGKGNSHQGALPQGVVTSIDSTSDNCIAEFTEQLAQHRHWGRARDL